MRKFGFPLSTGLKRVFAKEAFQFRPLKTDVVTPKVKVPSVEASGVDALASVKTEQYEAHKLSILPDSVVFLSKEEGLSYYEKMLKLRVLEKNFFRGAAAEFPKASPGFEGIAVGLQAALRPVDIIVSSRPTPWWLHFVGRNSFSNFEKSLNSKGEIKLEDDVEFYDFDDCDTDGDWVATGTGVALRNKIKKKSSVSFIFCDGRAANRRGYVDETLHLAKMWNLPSVYVFENETVDKGESATPSQFNRNVQLCNDVLSVREATGYSIAHCLAERGPIILEIFSQRQQEKESGIVRHDPIERLKKSILEAKLASIKELGEIEVKVNNNVKGLLNGTKVNRRPGKFKGKPDDSGKTRSAAQP